MILKNGYYCLIAGLPEITWDDRKLAISVSESAGVGSKRFEVKKIWNF